MWRGSNNDHAVGVAEEQDNRGGEEISSSDHDDESHSFLLVEPNNASNVNFKTDRPPSPLPSTLDDALQVLHEYATRANAVLHNYVDSSQQ
jgi:hypothetical protein